MSLTSVRIDKWLWAARFYKTRSLAQAAVEAGQATLNGERVKPAKEVRASDLVSVRIGEVVREVAVAGISDKRSSAAVASKLYAESEESVQKRTIQAENRRLGTEPAANLQGRPTKRVRRTLEKLRGY